MGIVYFIFYVFAFVLVASSIMVIASRNPVHSVLFLILAFFNAAGLFILVGAEFLAMVLVVVYVGAVAVLFMFVVMMLNINFVQMREGFLQYLGIGTLVGLILLVEIFLVLGTWAAGDGPEVAKPAALTPDVDNTTALGLVLYTEYFLLFQVAGAILLVAIIGAITLTLRKRPNVRRQDIGKQLSRDRKAAVELKDVKTGAGI